MSFSVRWRLGIGFGIIGAVLLGGCANYLTRTNLDTLQRGLTKQQFIDMWHRSAPGSRGSTPSSSRTFHQGADTWEVWIYDVYDFYSVTYEFPRVDHQEYVAFENGILIEWGQVSFPLTILHDGIRIEVPPAD